MKTVPYSFRMSDEDRELVQRIAGHIGADMAGAIKHALRETARTIEKEQKMGTKLDNILTREDIRDLRKRMQEAQGRESEERRVLAGYVRHDDNHIGSPYQTHHDNSQQERDLAYWESESRRLNDEYTHAINAACAEAGIAPYFVGLDKDYSRCLSKNFPE